MSTKKLTIEFVKESFKKEGYTLLSEEYVNAHSKLNYICPKGHQHTIRWYSWSQGRRCPSCAFTAKPSIKFIRESFEKENYILLDTVYINSYTKLNYICPDEHRHSIRWNSWQDGNRCPSCAKNNRIGQRNPGWKGGAYKRNLSMYDTYSSQLLYCEETRRDPNEEIILQVKCTKCNEWFSPKLQNVRSRIKAINNLNLGEHHFYCSDECKYSCSIFNRKKYPANEKHYKIDPNFTSAELDIWSKEVLKRANHLCEYCSVKAEHAHHIQPKKLEPFLALDPDNGVACCKECHYKYGHTGSCSTGTLAIIVCN